MEMKKLHDHQVLFSCTEKELPFQIRELPPLVACVNARPFLGKCPGYWQVTHIDWMRESEEPGRFKINITLRRVDLKYRLAKWYKRMYNRTIEPFRTFSNGIGRGWKREWVSFLWHGFLRMIQLEKEIY